jgi:hypothetical protein
MQEINYPYFNRDRILKIEMLENLRNFPRDFLDVYVEDLSDGIVSGLNPIVQKNNITFSKGIIKYKSKTYIISNPAIIDYSTTEVEVSVKINFHDVEESRDYSTQYISIELDKDMGLKKNQIEICRFKLKKGAYLRSDYQDLYDFTTEYNTINIVNVSYAGYKNHTLSHLILKYFAKEALSTRTQNAMDINFCMLCLNSNLIERDTIQNYIAYKLEEEIKELTNIELHEKLVIILEKIKKENFGLRRRASKERRVILD